MSKLLLDTHVLIWVSQGSRKLGKKASRLVTDPAVEVWLSAVSVWEIANKVALGRLRLRDSARKWLSSEASANNLSPLPLTQEHALAAAELPRYHEDPFDRLLIGQAQVEDLKIMTADPQFERYNVRLIDATA